MTCTKELEPMELEFNALTTEWCYAWDKRWNPSTGVANVDHVLDIRDIQTPVGGATFEAIPAIQYAGVRTDRPDAGAIISGTAMSTATATHYLATLAGSTQFWFRRGVAYRLTAGTKVSAQARLYTAFRSCGTIFPAREIVFNPTNNVNLGNYFPLTGPFAAKGVDKVKAAIIGMDNLNSTLRYDIFARAFNDPMARGAWTSLLGWTTPSPTTGDFTANTGELAVTGLSLATKQWMELALGVRKNADLDTNSRCIFHVIPAVKYA